MYTCLYSAFPCRTQRFHPTWRTWRRRSGRFWWPRRKWRSTNETLRCWWTCSTVWPSLTPARQNSARHGWTAWPASMWRTETCLRYTNTHQQTHTCIFCPAKLMRSGFVVCLGSHVLRACCGTGGRVPAEEGWDTDKCDYHMTVMWSSVAPTVTPAGRTDCPSVVEVLALCHGSHDFRYYIDTTGATLICQGVMVALCSCEVFLNIPKWTDSFITLFWKHMQHESKQANLILMYIWR